MSIESAPIRVLTAGNCAAVLGLLAAPEGGQPVQAHPVCSAEEVIARLAEPAPDLILVDVDCRDLGALQLCRILKELPETMLLPVIAVGRSVRRRLEAVAAGADDFVTQQVPPAMFRARVAALIRASAARRKLGAAQLVAQVEQREKLRQMFRRYLSPRVADRILGDAELRDSMLARPDLRARAVVMFADMRGFTSISEQLSPDEVVRLLNEYFSLLTEIAFRHDGTVFHMAGDGLMVGFGVPLEQLDRSVRALATAREMLQGFAELARSWRERYGVEAGLGIGVNEGEVVAGNVGGPAFMHYTIIGDAVNVASRLSQRARAGEVLFSRAVKRSLEESGFDVDALELPPFTVRGRSSPIDIYCLPLPARLELGLAAG